MDATLDSEMDPDDEEIRALYEEARRRGWTEFGYLFPSVFTMEETP